MKQTKITPPVLNLDPVSQESWNALTLQEIAKILEMPNPNDNPMRNLPAWAQTQMDELKALRAKSKKK
jgi:hypothetical protein